MDDAALQQYLALDDQVRDLDERLKRAKAEKASLEERIIKEFETAGVSNMRLADGRTVYLHRQLWARAKKGMQDEAIRALHSAGLDDLVHETFNTNQLSAYVRELDAMGAPLPHTLDACIDVAEVFSARVRRG